MENIRWAFNCAAWKPSKSEWMLAAQCIQPEEKERIGRFYYKKDAKSALAGRLLIRKLVSESLHIPYKDIKLARMKKGKPYLLNDIPNCFPNFNFNASHQGSFAVIVADPVLQVGIDVMKIENRGSSVANFFHTMRKQLTDQEWVTIKETLSDYEKLTMFYRHWCLKESYIKALGIGLGYDLQRLSFIIGTDNLSQDCITQTTKLCIDGKLTKYWKFEETMLDKDHCVAVALGNVSNVKEDGTYCVGNPNNTNPFVFSQEVEDASSPKFKILTFNNLTTGCQPLSEPDEEYWNTFVSKHERP